MFAHALGCTVLAMLFSTPLVSDSSGRTFCGPATDRGDVMIETAVPQRDQATFDGEFPRRLMTVWFDKPMKVGDRILMGRYLIEHDDVRMAHGYPCTYIYIQLLTPGFPWWPFAAGTLPGPPLLSRRWLCDR